MTCTATTHIQKPPIDEVRFQSISEVLEWATTRDQSVHVHGVRDVALFRSQSVSMKPWVHVHVLDIKHPISTTLLSAGGASLCAQLALLMGASEKQGIQLLRSCNTCLT